MTKRDVSGPDGGLAHNPFGALKGRFASSESEASKAQPADADPAKGPPPPIGRVVVRFERKGRGGRTVTRAVGLGGVKALVGPIEDAAKRARKALGVGAHVEGGDLVVQGECVERLERWLRSEGLVDVVRGNG